MIFFEIIIVAQNWLSLIEGWGILSSLPIFSIIIYQKSYLIFYCFIIKVLFEKRDAYLMRHRPISHLTRYKGDKLLEIDL